MDLLSFPVKETVRMMASLLEHITNANDQLPLPGGVVSRFHARSVPPITIHSYLARILKYAPCANLVFISVLVYLDRMARAKVPFVVCSANIHRLLIAAVMVATKFYSDVFYTNAHYARVGGLQVAELNQLELEFLFMNEFNLTISPQEFQHYADRLLEHAMAEKARASRHAYPSPNTSTGSAPNASPPPPMPAVPAGAAAAAAAAAMSTASAARGGMAAAPPSPPEQPVAAASAAEGSLHHNSLHHQHTQRHRPYHHQQHPASSAAGGSSHASLVASTTASPHGSPAMHHAQLTAHLQQQQQQQKHQHQQQQQQQRLPLGTNGAPLPHLQHQHLQQQLSGSLSRLPARSNTMPNLHSASASAGFSSSAFSSSGTPPMPTTTHHPPSSSSAAAAAAASGPYSASRRAMLAAAHLANSSSPASSPSTTTKPLPPSPATSTRPLPSVEVTSSSSFGTPTMLAPPPGLRQHPIAPPQRNMSSLYISPNAPVAGPGSRTPSPNTALSRGGGTFLAPPNSGGPHVMWTTRAEGVGAHQGSPASASASLVLVASPGDVAGNAGFVPSPMAVTTTPIGSPMAE